MLFSIAIFFIFNLMVNVLYETYSPVSYINVIVVGQIFKYLLISL